MANVDQFIINGPVAALRPLLDLLHANPETAVLAVTRNDQADPERVVVSMDPARAAALSAALKGLAIVIEPDEFLHP